MLLGIMFFLNVRIIFFIFVTYHVNTKLHCTVVGYRVRLRCRIKQPLCKWTLRIKWNVGEVKLNFYFIKSRCTKGNGFYVKLSVNVLDVRPFVWSVQAETTKSRLPRSCEDQSFLYIGRRSSFMCTLPMTLEYALNIRSLIKASGNDCIVK